MVVTGAGSGIGRSTAVELACVGFRVVGVAHRNEGAQSLQEEAARRSVKLETVTVDLGDPDQRAGLMARFEPWGLVNNAGYMNAGRIQDVPLTDARRQIEVMVMAPVDLTLQALPRMIERGQGRIVNVTTSAVHTSTPLTGWYSAAKAAFREITDALRVELVETGVHVVDVEPGGYRTGIWDRARHELTARRPTAGPARPVYDRVIRNLDRSQGVMGDADAVAEAIAGLLTMGRPPAHRRIGPGARWLRVADAVVPDRVWDRAVAMVAGFDGGPR